MIRLSKKQIENRQKMVEDTSKPIEKRRKAHEELVRNFMNPKKDFNPETFDVHDNAPGYDVRKRPRVEPPRRLETMGLKPKDLLIGQRIGEFESKQDLYLLIAHLYNRVADLEDRLDNKK